VIDMAQHLLSVDATARYANPSANLVRPVPFISVVCISATILIRTSAFRFLRDITGRFGGDSN
jgi:hypothetical protein